VISRLADGHRRVLLAVDRPFGRRRVLLAVDRPFGRRSPAAASFGG
jgi:hypothetical protein